MHTNLQLLGGREDRGEPLKNSQRGALDRDMYVSTMRLWRSAGFGFAIGYYEGGAATPSHRQ